MSIVMKKCIEHCDEKMHWALWSVV